jgi:hypothetical protein
MQECGVDSSGLRYSLQQAGLTLTSWTSAWEIIDSNLVRDTAYPNWFSSINKDKFREIRHFN